MERAELLEDRFEIERQIRAGGMGEVFRARDVRSNATVAIKLLADRREHRTARFAREVDVLAELSHPGIVRYISHGTAPAGQLFLVMEWLDGEDLKSRLDRAALGVGEAVALATRAAEALGTAHAHGIVHRDLKPSNLFLVDGRVDQVKLIDFGIALKEGLPQLTQAGMMIGTPGYMAPEQARSNEVIDARADVFALGCVLFQCLTGAPAFDGDTPIAILGKVLFGEAPRLRSVWPDAPEDLDALLARMLARDPALRPSDGANLAAALAALGPAAHSAAVATPLRGVPSSALTGSERRFLAVVVLGPGAPGGAPDPEALRRAIRPYGGSMEQLADGTSIVVVDAERKVATDHAAQAARCALALRAVVRDRPIAIAMGRADSSRRMPEGDVIDRASRVLAQLPGDAGPTPIALDEVSAGLLDARFEVAETDAGLILCGERPLMHGARTLLGRPTACVGRDWELNALTGIFDECLDEPEARVALITAAAGMGKSRLGAEFIARVQQRNPRVAIWVGRGDSLRAGSTLDLLAQALRGALGIAGGEPVAERRDRIRNRVAEHVPATEHKRVAEFLGELVGTPFPDDEDSTSLRAARHDAQLMSEQMRKAWTDFLDAEAAAHPVLILLEDLHWGDFGTVRFIDTALRDRGERPWMVLALARPEVFETFPRLWADRQNVQEIRLKELGRKAGERLVRQVLGDNVGPETIERLVKQADGNAFYLEELIRASAEGKDKALPDTVLAMVETRLGQLAVEARRVLRAASVFGEACWEGGVVVLLGGAMTAATVGEWLARLVEQEVLAVRPDGPVAGERAYMFRHSLLREGAYAMLTQDDRRLGHRLAGEWLEQHGEGDAMMLAGHFERGGDGERAARYYLRASEQAFQVLDLDATLAHASLGLACEPSPALRMALLGMRCEGAGHNMRLVAATMGDVEELLRLAPRGSLAWSQAMLCYNEGILLNGRIEQLLALIPLLREVEPVPEAVGRMALILLSTICMLDAFGFVAQAHALEDQFLAFSKSRGEREPIVQFWWHIAIGMRAGYAHDDAWRGLRHSDAIQAIYDVLGSERIFLNMQMFRALNLWYLGAFEAAERILDAIVAADEALGPASSLRRLTLAWLHTDAGALDTAHAVATQLAEYGHAHHNPLEEGRGRWVLAEVMRQRGDLDAAERELAVALTMAVPLERPGVLGTLSALRLAQGRAAEALAAADDGLAQCATMGGCGMFRGAFLRMIRAEALHATGAHDAARRAIADARSHLLDVASRITDPAFRAIFLDLVPENARTLALARTWLGDALTT
jgi:eukaryotic-like serine/threonine-protein kinase